MLCRLAQVMAMCCHSVDWMLAWLSHICVPLVARTPDGAPYESNWSGTALDLTKPAGRDYVGLGYNGQDCSNSYRGCFTVKEGKADFGYNARTDKYEKLLAAGVIDPTKVSRVALEHAASIAGMLLTTECVIADKPKKEEPAAPHGAPGMGGMDY